MSVDKDVAPEGVTLLDFAPHMHRHGRRLWTEVLGKSDGTSIEPTQFADKQSLPFRKIGHIDNFDADLNFIWPLTHQERLHKLKTGDLLATTCIFNTAGETLPVSGGFGSYDEMCINFVVRRRRP